MGDRALVQFVFRKEKSPVVYLHWNGFEVGDWLKELKDLMYGREGDLQYTAARFVGICHTHITGNTGLGVWDTYAVLTEVDSHGDFGIAVVDLSDWTITCGGGYGLEYNRLYRTVSDNVYELKE